MGIAVRFTAARMSRSLLIEFVEFENCLPESSQQFCFCYYPDRWLFDLMCELIKTV
ncbi:unknown protein [Microcystis aeruginosa NIES-843]|uniref:Uncharacterized protein n=1 Tax=Microcystis aeruginosa (strain NIES-843 / IAM M-2473) TaxID=449447 RepID=B0JKH7_MICAN|nr:unknown protein [Microcystis aeruginosa NIES-843]